MKNERYRNEWKYLISYGEMALLRQRLAPMMELDRNARDGRYKIRSLYFDDYWNSALAEKEAGVLQRKKYRIRIYNDSDDIIRLERKKKFGSYIFKESAKLTRGETEKLIGGEYEFLLYSDQPLCREFYVECVSHVMRPRVIVDYEREAWTMDEGTVRITFDTDVRAAVGGYALFDNSLPAFPVLEADKLVLEVKFTEMLPQMIREVLPPQNVEFTALSKYVLCCEKTAYLHGFGYYSETEGVKRK